MKIKVLGSSSSGNSYVLETENGRLILDAGVKLNEIMRAIRFEPESVAACLVTHSHRDHSQSAYDLARRGVRVLSCNEVAEQTEGVEPCLPRIIESFPDKGFWAVPFDVPHGDTECYGYLIVTNEGDRLLYATDYEYIPYNFREQRLTHMLIECNYASSDTLIHEAKYEHVLKGHSSLQTALGVVEANMTYALRCVVLCHVSAVEDGEAMREQVQNLVGENVAVYVARKGDVYEY